jgi:hypothetical protein
VRALSDAQFAMLRGDHIGIDYDSAEGEGVSLDEVAHQLIARGCLVRYQCAPGFWGHAITELGRLALRVSRPEMAFRVTP